MKRNASIVKQNNKAANSNLVIRATNEGEAASERVKCQGNISDKGYSPFICVSHNKGRFSARREFGSKRLFSPSQHTGRPTASPDATGDRSIGGSGAEMLAVRQLLLLVSSKRKKGQKEGGIASPKITYRPIGFNKLYPLFASSPQRQSSTRSTPSGVTLFRASNGNTSYG